MEEELKSLIEESKRINEDSRHLLDRLSKILNTMLVVAGILFIPFLYSFIDTQVAISDLRKNAVTKDMLQESKDEIYNKFVLRVDALSVHMFESDWINTQLYRITHEKEYLDDRDNVQRVIKAFFSSQHRSGGEKKDGIDSKVHSNQK